MKREYKRIPTRPSAVSSQLPSDPTPLLLSSTLSSEDVGHFLTPYGIEQPTQADTNLQSMAGDPEERRALAVILPELLESVSETADPDQALNAWEHFAASGIHRRTLFQFLAQAPRMLHLVCAIFGNSPAMAETLIRDPMLIYWLAEERVELRSPSRKQRDRHLRESLATFRTYELKCDALRRFKRKEMLHIGIRDLLQVADVKETVSSLSDLATVLIQAAYEIVQSHLSAEHGIPTHEDLHGQRVETGFVVLGMGKLGGGELNYSSDVDLVYVYEASDGQTQHTSHQMRLSNEEYFEKLARELTHILNEATDEGAVFRVDLRLRPEGDVGSLAKSLDDSVRYYRTRGRDWERMAFIKSYPIAGDRRVGRKFLRQIRSFIWGRKDDPSEQVLQTVQSLKAKIQKNLLQRGEDTRHVKLGIGGIREIEFLVQAFQLLHVHQYPKVMERNTLKALDGLSELKLLSRHSAEQLTRSYQFLRDLEHKLQMVNDLQTHVLPRDLQEIAKCAIRMGYKKCSQHADTAQAFLDDYGRHTSEVHRIYRQNIEGSH